MRLFGHLIDALNDAAPQNRPVDDQADDRYRYTPFFEAYFSNFIEGTEFDLPDALAVVYDGATIPNRFGDSHDLLGTYQLVSNLTEMRTVASTPEEFIQILRHRNGTIMAGRPETRPGEFKEKANRAGDTSFVLPAWLPARCGPVGHG